MRTKDNFTKYVKIYSYENAFEYSGELLRKWRQNYIFQIIKYDAWMRKRPT